MTTMSLGQISTHHAMDQAFAGVECHIISEQSISEQSISEQSISEQSISERSIDQLGAVRLLDVQHWRAEADGCDRSLFVDPCRGATLDIGCGPGRLAAALTSRGIPAMGIDMSIEAIRQARQRGAVAIRRNVFSTVPGEGRWDCALLADGNLGIGGDPVRLLRRVADLLRPGGDIIAEVDPERNGIVRERVRLRVGERMTAPFIWASVGIDGIEAAAAASGLVITSTQSVGQRHTATLRRAVS